MRENRLRTIWSQGGAVVNGWLAIPSTFSAETMAHQGWDSLCVDLQHGVVDYQMAVNMLTAISNSDTVPIVRVPWLEEGILGKVLDAGAYGVICPMVNTVADAERLVKATHYAPVGSRSVGPIRALLYGGQDYLSYANDTIAVFAQIETKESLDNLEAILQVPGLDAVYIGPADLSLSLGCQPKFDDVDPPVAEAIEYVVAKSREHGVVAAIHNGTAEYAVKRIEMGFQLVTIASDARLLAAGAQQVLAEMHQNQTNSGGQGRLY